MYGRSNLPESTPPRREVVLVALFGLAGLWGVLAAGSADPMRDQGRVSDPAMNALTVFALAVLLGLVLLIIIGVVAGWLSRSWRMGLAAAAVAALGFPFGLVVVAVLDLIRH
jgi:hypothetical protein